LSEWHVTPEYINEHWTEELFAFLFEKRNEKLRRFNNSEENSQDVPKIENGMFFRAHGITVKKV
jgi:hypothetical protein